MNDYGTLGFNANTQYEVTSDDVDFVEYVSNYIREALKGNTDYIHIDMEQTKKAKEAKEVLSNGRDSGD